MAYVLKPFVVNLNDLAFLLKQVNFIPLFDAAVNGNGVVDWDGSTPIYDAKGNLLSPGANDLPTQLALIQQFGRLDANTNTYVAGFPQLSSPIGVRDVSGLHNNLFGTQADWGAVDVPFHREVAADFNSYVTTPGADYSHTGSVLDFMPRIISRTITTAGVNLLKDGPGGHFVNWDQARYSSDTAYAALIDNSGVNIANLVDGAKIVAPLTTEIAVLDAHGAPLLWNAGDYSLSGTYAVTLATYNAVSLGGLFGSATGGPLVDGGQIWVQLSPGTFIAPPGLLYDADLFAYRTLVNASGIDFGLIQSGDIVNGDAIVTTIEMSGYGLLETLGHIDFQQPDSGEFFIGSENPGVAPVNSWFGIFGQFFDHGLDLIGKAGNGKVTIQLETTDPLYRAPGTDGPTDPGNTKITVTRAAIDNQYIVDASNTSVSRAGVDGQWGTADDYQSLGADNLVGGTGADADVLAPQTPTYVNHTSPFIDQSQTYGSVDQITNLLREWVSTDGGATYHAGIELFDGTTLVDAWTRKWPDGSTSQVHDTLPTLSELRNHVADTGRAELTWDDVADFRNRAADGSLSTGNSGHALILDMNPRFDAAHLASTQEVGLAGDTVAARVAAAVTALNSGIQATITNGFGTMNPGRVTGTDSLTQNVDGTLKLQLGVALVIPAGAGTTTIPAGDYGGANAMMLWVNFADFSIMAPPASAANSAVGEILMAAVGDHYIAGDGRVNENFGLTSIHHVFHEEHNFQVENLKTWIYQHDTNNSPLTHDGLHAWQVNTGFQDGQGNYTHGVGGAIAWDADKMFEATKLIVEMEYQHAAVDQYARTITPRIQEFVGYSTGIDSAISLEYAQVAFRFGHSTIRETIDTIDPSGWMMGHVTRYALEKAFLNPQGFADEGVAAITLGLARQQMNEVDEFITPALNQGLLGQPLDLAAINIARGRDLGIPTLNDFREGISLARYTSWDDFGKNMFHPESLVNFIAAYSFNGDVALAEAAMLDADFMNNTGTTIPTGADGFEHIDSWIGGLAEVHVPGGLLGETFDAVFVAQIQSLMDGDRFYYLYRLFGTNIHEEVNNGQFKDIVERNTGLEHLNGSIFAYADKYYDFNRDALPTKAVLHNLANTINYYTDDNGQLYEARTGTGTALDPYIYTGKIDALNPLPVGDTALFLGASTTAVSGSADHGYGVLLASDPTKGIYSDGGASTDQNGTDITVVAADGIRSNANLTLIRDLRPELDPTQVHPLEGTSTSGADSHEVIVATENTDYIHARGGDDTVYGEGGDDYLFGDGGIDRLYGGDGNDLLDSGEGPDLVDGGAGKDIIYGRGSGSEVGGFDQLVGGSGNDLVIGGEGIDKLSGGQGDDIIYGDGLTNPEMGNTDAFTHGGDGNDYIDTGASGDLIYAEEGDDYLVGGIDQDLMQGGSGDDILRPGTPSQASGTVGGPDEVVGDDGIGNVGFDLIDLSDYAAGAPGVTIDLSTQANPLVAIDAISPFPAWFEVEGAIGTQNGDTFIGDSLGDATAGNSLGGNWLIGGSGNDTFTGKGGNDLIVGGSIRLDQLIGKYADAATAEGPGNLVIGSAEWLADAMQTGTSTTSGNEGYDNNSENAYSGTSNRAAGALSGGLLAGAGFDPHFTEMLRSRMFKDVVLGDNGTDGTADTAVFTGNRADYTIVGLDSAGLVTNVEADIFALKISDTRDPNAVDVDGVLIPTDGVDLVVGVETLKFNGSIAVNVAENAAGPIASINGFGTTTYSLTGPDAALFAINQTTGELTFVNAPNFEAPGDVGADNVYNVTVNSNGAVSFAQNVVVTVTNIDEPGSNAINITNAAVTTPTTVTLTGLNVVTDADAPIVPLYVWSNGVTTAQNVVTATAAIQTITLSGGYTDAFGVNPLLGAAPAAPQTAIIGTVGNNVGNNVNTGALNGTVGADFMIGLAGNDTYVANDAGDVVVEALAGGTDTVLTSLTSYTLTANVENLTFNNGNAADVDFSATGNALANTLTGGSANDTFNMIVDDVRDNVRGGDGVDTADYSAYTTNLTVTLNATVNTDVAVGGSGSANGTRDLIRSIENFVGGSGNDVITGAAGDNTLSGSAGDDTLNYSVTTQGVGNTLTSGRDFIDGGDSTTVGDRFVLNGNNQGEAFQIISRTDPANAVLLASLNVTFNANTEIVVTRNGVVIAELDNIEEITINNQAVTTGGGNTAGQGADSVAIVGNFSGTSLALNTITINGGLGSDTVDISGLTSDHRIVFNTNGANDQVVGTVRPQDIVGGYSEGTTDPTTNVVAPDCYMFGPAPQLDQDDDRTIEQTSFVAENGVLIGNDNNNILVGDENVQAILANAGDDVVRAGDAATVVDAGSGADVVDGSGHEDILIGGLGDDLLDGRAGADKIWGEQGSDIIFGGDGDDIVFGGSGEDELHGGAGTDRLEGGRDADALWGGADDDVFVFRTTQDANGDVVSDFTPGDRIDLHFIDADQATTANDAFIIVTGTTFTGAGELIVRFDASNNQTFVEGNTDSNVATAEFQLAFSGDQVNQLKTDGIIH